MNGPQRLSIVVPVYRGESFLAQLVEEIGQLRATLQQAGSPIALERAIFVDDAAVDGSARLLDGLASAQPWIEVVHLGRNAGQHAATAAGFARCQADWIATLDEDLQHRPQSLLELLAAAASASADLAYAAPLGSVHRTFYRDFSSRLAKRGICRLSGNPNVRHFNSFRLVRGTIARAAAGIFASEVYLDIALSWFTERVVAVPVALVDRRDLTGQASGYDFLALARHAQRMIVSSWSGPPRTAGKLVRPAVDRSRDGELRDFLTVLAVSAGDQAGSAC
ncbi:MAG: glycosyltransferase [Thermoanaerobaculia bacterium]